MKLTFLNGSKRSIDQALFKDLLKKAPSVVPAISDFKSVELWLTTDEEIHKLNKQYRGKDKPTDVLSFPTQSNGVLGQLVISVETTERQAEELGQSFDEEIRFLFTHGLLHLLGYDHENPEDEKLMLEKAYELLGRKA